MALRVEVVYATPQEQLVINVEVPAGTTVRQAIERSGVTVKFPDAALVTGQVGIFGKLVEPDAPVRAGDRVEIYRQLVIDPKEARRRRDRRRR